MKYGSGINSSDLISRMRLRGLLMCVALPLVLLLGIWLLRNSLSVSQRPLLPAQIYVFIAAGLSGPAIGYFTMRLTTRQVRSFILQDAQ